MVRWADVQKKSFLSARRPGWAAAQEAGTTGAFVHQTLLDMSDVWALPEPSPELIASFGGNINLARAVIQDLWSSVS